MKTLIQWGTWIMGQITATRNLVATKVVRHAGQLLYFGESWTWWHNVCEDIAHENRKWKVILRLFFNQTILMMSIIVFAMKQMEILFSLLGLHKPTLPNPSLYLTVTHVFLHPTMHCDWILLPSPLQFYSCFHVSYIMSSLLLGFVRTRVLMSRSRLNNGAIHGGWHFDIHRDFDTRGR